MMISKDHPIQSEAIRRAARDHYCTLRIPGVCNGRRDTTVLAHPPIGNGGMSLKGSDIDGAFACSDCHDVVDGRTPFNSDRAQVLACWIRGSQETRRTLVKRGLLSYAGMPDQSLAEVSDDDF